MTASIPNTVTTRRINLTAAMPGYAIAVLTIFSACVASCFVYRFNHEKTFTLLFFFTAVAVSGGYGGMRAGIFATLISSVICDYYLFAQVHSLYVARTDVPAFVLFIFLALFVNLLSGKLQSEKVEADKRFQNLVEDLETIVWEINPSTHQFSFVSKYAETMLGYPLSMWYVNADIRKVFIHSDNISYVEGELNKLMRNGGTTTIEYQAKTMDDQDTWIRETINAQLGTNFHPVRISGLCVDITRERIKLDEIRRGRERLHQLSIKLVTLQESESRAMALELHDEIGQALTGLKLKLEMSMRQGSKVSRENIRQGITELRELMNKVSEFSMNLHPSLLDNLGLVPALEWQFERFTRLMDVEVIFNLSAIPLRIASEVEITAYRIIQEALTNVARHAGVDKAYVNVWMENEVLCLEVKDYGVGFDVAGKHESMGIGGLLGMLERVHLVGGAFKIEFSPHNGVCLKAELPLRSNAEVQHD